jgi:hypothetical protein
MSNTVKASPTESDED